MAKQLNTNILDIVGSPTITSDGIASFTINNGFTIKSSAYTNSLVIILKLYYQTLTETSGANTIMRESKTNSDTSIYIDSYNQYRVAWYSDEYGKSSDSNLEIYKFRPDTYCFLRITYTNSSINGEILKDNITVTTTLEEALANSNWINLSWDKAVSNYFTDRLFQIGGSNSFGWGGTIDLSNSSINGQKMFTEQTTHYSTHIQLRRDTAANWTSVNPTLLQGEVGLETDTGKSKVGDGSTAWNSLAYDLASTALQSHQSLANYVTLNTAQTITGTKTFGSNAYIKSDQFRSTNDDLIFYTGNSNYCYMGYHGRKLRLDGSTTRPQYSTDASTYKDLALYSDIPTVPTNISAFTNDSGYITGITSSDVTTALGYTPVDTNLSNLSSTGTKVLDGQWVAVNIQIASNVSVNGSTDLTYTLSDVPNDGNKYEVLLTGQVYTSNSSGNQGKINVSSNIVNGVTICGAITRTSQSNIAFGSAIIPVGNRQITVQRDTSWNATFNLYIRGYRRIGSNS